jgi:hypothetical protein
MVLAIGFFAVLGLAWDRDGVELLSRLLLMFGATP